MVKTGSATGYRYCVHTHRQTPYEVILNETSTLKTFTKLLHGVTII